MAGVSTRAVSSRAASWGADAPVGEEQARERLLAAAEACYAERGPGRTRMSDIASRAGVHRRTVYDYFPSKDALLAASFVRAISGVLDATEYCWHTDEPFLIQLVNSVVLGLEAARNSPTMALLIGADELGRTFRAAEASEAWGENLAGALGHRLEEAMAGGGVRGDPPSQNTAA